MGVGKVEALTEPTVVARARAVAGAQHSQGSSRVIGTDHAEGDGAAQGSTA
jgi:hypothetical protein